jgi:phosphoadenosine phosphosulfate reductase
MVDGAWAPAPCWNAFQNLHDLCTAELAADGCGPGLYGNASTERQLEDFPAEQLISWSVRTFGSRLVMSTSFGIQSAVTLHLVSRICPSIPVIWVDTGYLPAETHRYAETLTQLLHLNLHVVRAELSPADMEARYGRLWESENVEDLNLYDRIRKVEPMRQALAAVGAAGWISGLRAEQTAYRRGLPRVQRSRSVCRIYPLLHWTRSAVCDYLQKHQLPPHPLSWKGYATVGDAHSSRPLCTTDSDDRVTRFRGLKQECGLHLT